MIARFIKYSQVICSNAISNHSTLLPLTKDSINDQLYKKNFRFPNY